MPYFIALCLLLSQRHILSSYLINNQSINLSIINSVIHQLLIKYTNFLVIAS